MEFKQEGLVETEIVIAGYLLAGFSLRDISETTALSKKHLNAHIKNMMQKLKAEDMEELIKYLRALESGKLFPGNTL